MRVRKPRGLSGLQIGLATILGIAGGVYIWRPLFVQFTASGDKEKVAASIKK